jgi:hypothetical protein
VAVGAPHVALGDLRFDHPPRRRDVDQEGDLSSLVLPRAVVEVEAPKVRLSAVHTGSFSQVLGKPPAVGLPSRRGTERHVRLVLRLVLDVPRLAALTAPRLSAIGGRAPDVEGLERLVKVARGAALHEADLTSRL